MTRKAAKVLLRVARLGTEVLSLLPYLASGWVPRKKGRWVFGAWHGNSFSDNTRFMYEYCQAHGRGVEPIWLSRDRGVRSLLRSKGMACHHPRSLRGIFSSATAAVGFVTHGPGDLCAPCVRGALIVNLTHGTPIKRIGRDARAVRFGPLTRLFDLYVRPRLPSFRFPDLIFTASDEASKRFRSAFRMREGVVATGYPRWDPLLADTGDSSGDDLGRPRKRSLLYAPTHRMFGRGGLDIMAIPGFDRLLEWMEANDAELTLRPHRSLDISEIDRLQDTGKGRIRIADHSSYPDISALLTQADILISDYSSVIYDFLVLKRPIVLLAHDLDAYKREDAGLYDEYEREFAGLIARSWSEVVELISGAGQVMDRVSELYRVHGRYADGDSCTRIESAVWKRVGLPVRAIGLTP